MRQLSAVLPALLTQRAAAFGVLVTLTHLDPHPYAGRPTAPQDYQASLRVDRIAGS